MKKVKKEKIIILQAYLTKTNCKKTNKKSQLIITNL